MTANEIIVALEKMKAEDPERFYKALGYGDQGAGIMSRFVSGSYELGLVAGALWMQEQKLSPISCGHENGTEWSEDDQHQKEQVLNALRLELNKWLNHSVRGMKSGNHAYFQGKITLIHDLLGFIHDIDNPEG